MRKMGRNIGGGSENRRELWRVKGTIGISDYE
jgi:hypothetical protein